MSWKSGIVVACAVVEYATAAAGQTDHYLCRQIKDLKVPAKFAAQLGITVVDQTGSDVCEAKKPFLLCDPVDKNGSGILDPTRHYCCYKLKCTTKPEASYEIDDQFWSGQISTKKPKFLCNLCTTQLVATLPIATATPLTPVPTATRVPQPPASTRTRTPTSTPTAVPTATPSPSPTPTARRDAIYVTEASQEAPSGDPAWPYNGNALPGDCACGTGGVSLHNGDLHVTAVDLEIPSRGFPFRFVRTYKSQISYDGPLGTNWDFNYNSHLVPEPATANIFHLTGSAYRARYVPQADGSYHAVGFFARLVNNADGTITLHNRDGTQYRYTGFDGSSTAGALLSIRDRQGDLLQLLYDGLGRLITIRDTLGRDVTVGYDAAGRVNSLQDFSGRTVTYEYDANGDLVAVTSPAVTGTINGNDFPSGKTTRYSYLTSATAALNHNLLTIKRPNEVAVSGAATIDVTYGTDAGTSLTFDRVTQRNVGGLNQAAQTEGLPAAGGRFSYFYQTITACTDVSTACTRTIIVDRVGNVHAYDYNVNQNVLRAEDFTGRVNPLSPGNPPTPTGKLRPTDPASFVTLSAYNADSLVTQVTAPLSNQVQFTYDSANSDRLQQGNLLQRREVRDGVRGGDQLDLVTSFTYEPIYNHLRTVCDPRGSQAGFQPPIDPGTTGCSRYSTLRQFDYEESCDFTAIAANVGRTATAVQTLLTAAGMCTVGGDLNSDGVVDQIAGNLVRNQSPTVHLIGGGLQSIVELLSYNRFGQLIKTVDPEGNVTEHSYFPERDPDGDGLNLTAGLAADTGGYLREVRRDTTAAAGRNSGTNPPVTNVRSQYQYDRIGNTISAIDGRGIETRYAVNQLNQVVQITRAAAVGAFAPDPAEPVTLTTFGYRERIEYDFNNNVMKRQVEDRGDTSTTGGFVDYGSVYDILDNVIAETRELGGSSGSLTTRYRYDANQNQTTVIEPKGNSHTKTYDERDLLFQSTRGAGGSSGGTPATMTYHYDRNRNLVETVDAADTDGSPDNNSASGGSGDAVTYQYDGFDRRKVTIDAVGNRSEVQYDPAGNIVLETHRGPVGGSSPSNKTGTANVDLARTSFQHDELNRRFQIDRHLFIPTGVSTQRPITLTEGPLTPGDGKVTQRYTYDRNSRRTFSTDDNNNSSRVDYDGIGRVIKTTDALNNTVESGYDDNNNVIETRQTDISSRAGVAAQVFLATSFYDSLNRLQRAVDNIGNSVESRYDSRNNVVAVADAKGPTSGTINRRIFSTGAVNINSFGNVSLYFYDGISRKVREERILTASGAGDGTNIGADLFGVKTTTPPPDVTQGGGDGKITLRTDWDANSLVQRLTDDNGNKTEYAYDNFNRRLTETKGICTPPPACAKPPTTITTTYDPDDNPINVTDENQSVITTTFDAVNRPTARSIVRGPNVVGTTATTTEYDGLSRMTTTTDNNDPATATDDSTLTYAYDSLGRVIEETQKIGALAAKPISSSWQAAARRVQIVYPNGRVVSHQYDALDRVTRITDTAALTTVATYDYIGDRVLERGYANGTRATLLNDAGTLADGYDALGRPIKLRHLRSTGAPLVAGFEHTYDRMSNKSIEKKLHTLGASEEYAYDGSYRLRDFRRGTMDVAGTSIIGMPTLTSTWALDGVGNWTARDGETRQHSSVNELEQRTVGATTTTLQYNSNGSQTDNGNLLFQWDYRDRLRAVSRKSDMSLIAVYSYDGEGRRIRKALPATATDYYLDGWDEVERRDPTGDTVRQQHIFGISIDEPLIEERDSDNNGSLDERRYYHENTLGSTFALTDATTAAAVVESYLYDPYGGVSVFDGMGNPVSPNPNGTPHSAAGNPYAFTGRELDEETGLYCYRARYYDAAQGRFLSRDGLGYDDTMSLYSYVGGAPTNVTDPSGNGPWPDFMVRGASWARSWLPRPVEWVGEAANSVVRHTVVESGFTFGDTAVELGERVSGHETRQLPRVSKLYHSLPDPIEERVPVVAAWGAQETAGVALMYGSGRVIRYLRGTATERRLATVVARDMSSASTVWERTYGHLPRARMTRAEAYAELRKWQEYEMRWSGDMNIMTAQAPSKPGTFRMPPLRERIEAWDLEGLVSFPTPRGETTWRPGMLRLFEGSFSKPLVNVGETGIFDIKPFVPPKGFSGSVGGIPAPGSTGSFVRPPGSTGSFVPPPASTGSFVPRSR